MLDKVIAEIRLAPGEVGYYDDYSRIYLNSARPVAKIYAGMNTTQIRKSIRSGRLQLISGTLDVVAAKPKQIVEQKPVKKEVQAPKPEPVPEPVEVPAAEPEPVAEPVAEPVEKPVAEAAPTEPAEEVPAKPRRRRKKAE